MPNFKVIETTISLKYQMWDVILHYGANSVALFHTWKHVRLIQSST